mgnify:CR=1 FL=1
MAGWLAALAFAAAAQQQPPAYQEPPEEDKGSARETEYAFNPLQAAREFRVGMFYWKKGSFKAAAGRFEEAVKWNPGYAEAWFRLAEARERLAREQTREAEREALLDAAAEAFKKYLELEPDGDRARTARRKLERMGRRSS